MANYYLIRNFTKNGALGISHRVFEEIARGCITETFGAEIDQNDGSIFRPNRPVQCNVDKDGIKILVQIENKADQSMPDIAKTVEERIHAVIYDMTEITPKKITVKIV